MKPVLSVPQLHIQFKVQLLDLVAWKMTIANDVGYRYLENSLVKTYRTWGQYVHRTI